MPRKDPLGEVIGVGNQKGGVGKTTNAVHLAAAFGLRGYHSLIIDLDPSAGATRHLGIPAKSYAGTLELLTTDETVKTLAITEKMPRGVHLIPSRLELNDLDKHLPKFSDRTRILEQPLAEACTQYDLIFLDTPPNPGAITTIAAYVTAKWFLLSVFPHHLSMESLAEAFNDIADVRGGRNKALEVLGILFTCVDGRVKRERQRIEDMITKAVPGRKCENFTSQANAVPQASHKGKTLFQVKRFINHRVAEQYRRLSAELEHRILNRDAFIAGTLGPPDYEKLLGSETPDLSLTPSVTKGEVDGEREPVAALAANE